jgi:putative membrane protein
MLFFGGIGYLSPLKDVFLLTTPFVITFCFLYLLLQERNNSKYIYYVVFVILFTFILEAVGVKTGLVFGSYDYGSTLGIKIFSTPIIIGLQWCLVVIGAMSLPTTFLPKLNIFLFVLLSGSIAVVFDIVIEPVAVELGYWIWSGGDVPIQNYVAWFIITFILALVFKIRKIKLDNPKYHYLVFTGFIFFFLFLRIFL